ncbi:MAG: hypothetical protein ACP5U2_03695, partial [Bryobacteraceae bacterium]
MAEIVLERRQAQEPAARILERAERGQFQLAPCGQHCCFLGQPHQERAGAQDLVEALDLPGGQGEQRALDAAKIPGDEAKFLQAAVPGSRALA